MVTGLAGCASVKQSVQGWMGEAPATTPAEGTVYFSAVEGLPMHAEASGAAPIVGRLALHEKVVRQRYDSGWAYVVSDGGSSGWVDNAQLIWRLPASSDGATAGPGDIRPTAAPAALATPLVQATAATPTPVQTASPGPPPTPAPTRAPVPSPTAVASPTPRQAMPELFDPY
jgi:hypothetical protein